MSYVLAYMQCKKLFFKKKDEHFILIKSLFLPFPNHILCCLLLLISETLMFSKY